MVFEIKRKDIATPASTLIPKNTQKGINRMSLWLISSSESCSRVKITACRVINIFVIKFSVRFPPNLRLSSFFVLKNSTSSPKQNTINGMHASTSFSDSIKIMARNSKISRPIPASRVPPETFAFIPKMSIRMWIREIMRNEKLSLSIPFMENEKNKQ